MISHSQQKTQKKAEEKTQQKAHSNQPHTRRVLIPLFLFSTFFISLFFVNCQCGVETTDTPSSIPCDPKDPNSDCDKDGIKDTADVDADNDGLIEIHTLAQFHAIRTDLDGDGISDEGATEDSNFRGSEGCPDGGCEGYELAGDLNFDENGDGEQNDTYNQDDGTWEWEFDPTAVFVASYENTINSLPPVFWEFTGCNTTGNIAHGASSLEHFNHCDGLFQGEVVEALTSGNQYASKVTIHNGNVFHLSNFFSPDSMSTNWTVRVQDKGVTLFQYTYTYSPYLSFLPSSEDYTDVTNQPGATANSSYSIRIPDIYNTNSFRGKFEYNGYSITWE